MDDENETSTKGHVAVRLPQAIIARIDALSSRFDLPGRKGTRSDAIRALVLNGLEVEERRVTRGCAGMNVAGRDHDDVAR